MQRRTSSSGGGTSAPMRATGSSTFSTSRLIPAIAIFRAIISAQFSPVCDSAAPPTQVWDCFDDYSLSHPYVCSHMALFASACEDELRHASGFGKTLIFERLDLDVIFL